VAAGERVLAAEAMERFDAGHRLADTLYKVQLFAVLGAGARESCLEDDLGLGRSPVLDGDTFLRAFEQALVARGVPFAHVGGEVADVSLDGARWVVCATPSAVKPELIARLRELAATGVHVTIGPGVPDRDGGMRRLVAPLDTTGLEGVGGGADDATAGAGSAVQEAAVEKSGRQAEQFAAAGR
jgi:beta-galactosidase